MEEIFSINVKGEGFITKEGRRQFVNDTFLRCQDCGAYWFDHTAQTCSWESYDKIMTQLALAYAYTNGNTARVRELEVKLRAAVKTKGGAHRLMVMLAQFEDKYLR